MKTFIQNIVLVISFALIAFSCNKEEDRVTYGGATAAPVLQASTSNDLVLTKDKADYAGIQFQWTNPNYQFSNGANTQDVNYTLQIDSKNDFSSSNKVEIAFVGSNSVSYTVSQFNGQLGKLELEDGKKQTFYLRIKSDLASNASTIQYSNTLTINATTYLDTLYPVPQNLYITGSATPAGWQSGSGTEVPPIDQTFTKINAFTFRIDKLRLVYNGIADGDNGFLLLPVYSSWSAKYGFTGDKHANNRTGDSFKPGGNDFSPPDTGDYKIEVNFKTGKYTMTKL